jgi:acylphosphatase
MPFRPGRALSRRLYAGGGELQGGACAPSIQGGDETDREPIMSERSVRLTVVGRVQGVAFRAFVQDAARRLEVAGWARNRSDGTVEVLAQGSAEAVDGLVAACRSGPPAARVDEVRIEEAAAGDAPRPFSVRPTV